MTAPDQEVIEAYRGWISGRPGLLEDLGELVGKRLACWCAPRACHGDVLAELVAERYEVPPPAEPQGKPCPRCNSRYGTVTGQALCRSLCPPGTGGPVGPGE